MIYHYTTLNTLALILDQRKIRFNRLDQVDDIQESTEFKELNLSKYLFVSCWTENPEENVALWSMYSKNMAGVRIGLKKRPFKLKKVGSKVNRFPIDIRGEKELPLTLDEIFHPNYFVFPFFMDERQFYKKIEYLDETELQKVYTNFESRIIDEKGNFEINVNTFNLGRIKHKRWSFQEETRFVLLILPPCDFKDIGKFTNAIFNQVPLEIYHFYLELDCSILQEVEITLGPNSNDSDRIIAEALKQKYNLSNEIKKSELEIKIRN